MKKSLSYRQKILLLALGCILGLLIFYGVCQLTIVSTIKRVKSENASLREQYSAVESYVLNKDFYASEMVENNKASNEILKCYANDVTDKSLLYEFDRRLDDYGMKSSALTLNDNEFIEEVTLDDKIYTLQTNSVSVSFDIELSELKKFITDIKEDDLNLAIQNIAIAPDESNGLVAGTLTINQNSILDSENKVKDPQYTDKTGVDELFD